MKSRIGLLGLRNPDAFSGKSPTAMATINRIAPGRVFCGIGSGNTAMRIMGHKPVTIAELDEYLRVLRPLLRGEEVSLAYRGKHARTKHLMPDAGFVDFEHELPAIGRCRYDPLGQAIQRTNVLDADQVISPAMASGPRRQIARPSQQTRLGSGDVHLDGRGLSAADRLRSAGPALRLNDARAAPDRSQPDLRHDLRGIVRFRQVLGMERYQGDDFPGRTSASRKRGDGLGR